MRLIQLWTKIFALALMLFAASVIAHAAGAVQLAVTSVTTDLLAVTGVLGGLLVPATQLRIRTMRQRAARATARFAPADESPDSILHAALAPLVEARAVRDLAAALIVRGEPVTFFPPGDSKRQGRRYEVGSLTKPMTGELLASLILDNSVTLSATIGELLADWHLAAPVANITLQELVTHRAGLGRLPRSLLFAVATRLSSDPYRWLSAAALRHACARDRRVQPVPTYSNLGFAVLGQALGRVHGVDYRQALQTRVLDPLALADTLVDAPNLPRSQRLSGHDRTGVPTPWWHTGVMAAAGGVSMTITDGARWLAAHVERPPEYAPVIARATEPLAAFGPDRIGMGWIIRSVDGRTVVWHNGATGGFSSFAAFDPDRGLGVIAFAASQAPGVLDQAGLWIMRQRIGRPHRD
ncbi:MAG TPA: serine hydrolase domain-containing protein [Gemmatimonadales bacterium]